MTEDPDLDRAHLYEFFYGPATSSNAEIRDRWADVVREISVGFSRPAIVGFQPERRPKTPRTAAPPASGPMRSWFGRVDVAAAGEEWPMFRKHPMIPLLQLNCRDLPDRPQERAGIQGLTVFGTEYDIGRFGWISPGDGWMIRTYPDITPLVPLPSPRAKLDFGHS